MTVLADFQTIIGDAEQRVDSAHQQLGGAFDTGGRITGNSEVGGDGAFLIFTVTDNLQIHNVYVNGEGPVGSIMPSNDLWSTQVIAIAGSRLKSGSNTISLRNVTETFRIKDLICFYHQNSD